MEMGNKHLTRTFLDAEEDDVPVVVAADLSSVSKPISNILPEIASAEVASG